MSKIIRAITIAAILSVPAISFAQSNTNLTRGQVRAELVQLEAAGYNPARDGNASYPADIEAAESKIAMQSSLAVIDSSAGGMPIDGSFAAGAAGHKAISSACVGPASFCNPYFGS